MKILIFNRKLPLIKIGGPCGYMYNIYEYLKENPRGEISFYPDDFKNTIRQRIYSKFERICVHKTVWSKLLNFVAILYLDYFFNYPLSSKEIDFINSFDYVHVHSVIFYLRFFYGNKKIKAKTILTSHSPEPLIDEISAEHGYFYWFNAHKKVRNFFIKRELLSYNDCSKIMFPVKDAREPYIHSSSLYRDCFEALNEKFFYVVTAVNDLTKNEENKHYLSRFNIPSASLRLCYIGRHTEVKGYDQLQLMAKKVWEKYPDVYFIIGGKEDPIHGLSDHRWIELGWVDTSALLNEIDVFILPNKNTYFDLILLEVLRQGNPVVLTRTGGNKWFYNKGMKGVLFYEYGDADQFLNDVGKCLDYKKNSCIENIKQQNRDFFCKEFNMKAYIENYLHSLELND